MSNARRLADLLSRWRESRKKGRELTPEDVCKDCPQLVDELRKAIRFQQELDQIRGPAESPGTKVPARAPEPALPALAGYEILEELGRGGMGSVYKVRHKLMGAVQAMKVVLTNRLSDGTAVARFRREIRTAAVLRHDNVVQTHYAGEVDGKLCLIMELLEGSDLARLLDRRRRLRVAAAVGLQYAHDNHQLVHRDIKPSNLMLTPEGRVKILDWGPEAATLTDSDSAPGTLSLYGP